MTSTCAEVRWDFSGVSSAGSLSPKSTFFSSSGEAWSPSVGCCILTSVSSMCFRSPTVSAKSSGDILVFKSFRFVSFLESATSGGVRFRVKGCGSPFSSSGEGDTRSERGLGSSSGYDNSGSGPTSGSGSTSGSACGISSSSFTLAGLSSPGYSSRGSTSPLRWSIGLSCSSSYSLITNDACCDMEFCIYKLLRDKFSSSVYNLVIWFFFSSLSRSISLIMSINYLNIFLDTS